MRKKRYRIGTALKRTYAKTKRILTKTNKSATMCAIKNAGKRVKNRFFTMIKKTKKSVQRMTRKANVSAAKKIRSIIKRRH